MTLQIQEPDALQENDIFSKALGIDLGTTHSLVAVLKGDKVMLLPLRGAFDAFIEKPPQPGEAAHKPSPYLMPSLVGFDGKDFVAGFGAENLRKTYPHKVAASIKRLMGQTYESQAAQSFPFPLKPLSADQNNKPGDDVPAENFHLDFGDAILTPTEGATLLLKNLKQGAETLLDQSFAEAVITVPAYFDEKARAATRLAAEKAGLKVLRLISEPTSAALAYGLDDGREGLYGVYDLGGGTFDFTLLEMRQGVFNVRATGGHTLLGGDDMDMAIAQHFLPRWQTLSTPQKQSALLAARHAKEALTHQDKAPFKPFEADPRDQNAEKTYVLDRQLFQAITAPLIQQTLDHVKAVLKDAGTKASELEGLICVGGATRTWHLKETLEKALAHTPLQTLCPDHVVAMGAARQAAALSEGGHHLLLDITPLSLGIEVMGQQVEPLIKRNTRIPVCATQIFTTAQNNQKHLRIHVLQGESQKTSECRSLGFFDLSNLPPLKAGEARIDVTFTLDRDGLLSVSATEQTTGLAQKITMKPNYGLGLTEAQKLLANA